MDLQTDPELRYGSYLCYGNYQVGNYTMAVMSWHLVYYRAVTRSENTRVPNSDAGASPLQALVDTGLVDLQKFGGAIAPRTIGLYYSSYVGDLSSMLGELCYDSNAGAAIQRLLITMPCKN